MYKASKYGIVGHLCVPIYQGYYDKSRLKRFFVGETTLAGSGKCKAQTCKQKIYVIKKKTLSSPEISTYKMHIEILNNSLKNPPKSIQ